jgi:oligoribonuclease
MARADQVLFWIDMEMSGLDPESCRILEIASLVTNNQLEVIKEGPSIVIHQPDEVLAAMDEWNTEHHGASGLTERVRASTISTEEAESQTLDALRALTDKDGEAVLCGNSIFQDRRFIHRYMPRLDRFFHYRMLDVSSLKILAQRWYPQPLHAGKKREAHRALDDIRESVAELDHYRRALFRVPPPWE